MIRKIVRFTKVEHTAFSLPLIFTGAWMGAGGHWPTMRIVLLIVVAAVGARIFGMSLNRIFDRRLDAMNPRTAGRELPSGAMGVGTAVGIALSGLLIYLLACYALGRWCLMLSPIPLVPLVGYSLLKRFTPLCHFGIGLCLAMAPIGAYVAAAGNPHLGSEVLLFAGFVFFWLSGADIIYALLDIESDRKNGIHSLPASLGGKGAQQVAVMIHILALGLLLALVITAKPAQTAVAAYFITVVLFVVMHWPTIPAARRFFPLAQFAGMAGAITPLFL
jgi:4-hydroxybenzoate polyprenyltransferase